MHVSVHPLRFYRFYEILDILRFYRWYEILDILRFYRFYEILDIFKDKILSDSMNKFVILCSCVVHPIVAVKATMTS